MKLSCAVLLCVTASAVAGPLKYSAGSILERRQTFTDPTCKLSKAVTPGTPLSFLFPVANLLGSIVGPAVKSAIGAENEERIDKLGDTLCVSGASTDWFRRYVANASCSNSQEEPAGQRGICQELLQAVRDLAQESTPTGQVKKYNCLLNLLCV